MQQISVLIVDDNEDLVHTLSLILRHTGYEVETALDGVAAVEKFKEQHFDLVLMDIIMPHMDGLEAFRRIREISPGAQVILMTAYYEEEMLQVALAEGARTAVYKPLDIPQTLELIRRRVTSPAVLVVDDDRDICQTMSRALELEGYRVYTAFDGEGAIKLIERVACRVAFGDVRLPNYDGLQTSLQLKRLNPDMITYMITGYGDEVRGLVEQALATSAVACLHKPLQLSEVIRLVKQSLRTERGCWDEGNA